MWEYYCKKCDKKIDNDEMEIREYGWYGDWEEFHIECDTKVEVILKVEYKRRKNDECK